MNCAKVGQFSLVFAQLSHITTDWADGVCPILFLYPLRCQPLSQSAAANDNFFCDLFCKTNNISFNPRTIPTFFIIPPM